MNKHWLAIWMLFLCAVGALALDRPQVEVTVDAASKYLWRGLMFYNDDPVIDPSVSVTWEGFVLGAWVLFPSESFIDADGGWDHAETDYTFSYTHRAGDVELTAGVVYYTLPSSGAFTHEAFVEASLPDVPLGPTVSVYRDLGDYGSLYASVAVSHTVGIPAISGLSATFGAGIGWGDRRYNEAYFDLSRRAFGDMDVSAAIEYAPTEVVALSVTGRYSWFVDDDVRDAARDPAMGYNGAAPFVLSASVTLEF
jgi:hypothetical protein